MRIGDLVVSIYNRDVVGGIVDIEDNGFIIVDWDNIGTLTETEETLRKPTQKQLRERKLKRILRNYEKENVKNR